MKHTKDKSNPNSKGMRNLVIVMSIALVLAIAALAVFCVMHFLDKRVEVEKGATVVTIGGVEFSENLFRFVCSMLLSEDEDLAYQIYTSEDLNAQTLVKQAAVDYLTEYVYQYKEAVGAGIRLTQEDQKNLENSVRKEYNEYKTVNGKELSEAEFYNYYYGLTKDQFMNFWENNLLVRKYNERCQANADTGTENQRMAYEEFEDYLHTYRCTVIMLKLEGLSEEKAAEKKALAGEYKAAVESGVSMESLVKKWCEVETVKENDGIIDVSVFHKENYPELYDWVTEAQSGIVEVIESGGYLLVARYEKENTLETLLGTEELIAWTKLFVVQRDLLSLIQSEKYAVFVNETVYAACDIGKVITDAISYWGYYWSSAGSMTG